MGLLTRCLGVVYEAEAQKSLSQQYKVVHGQRLFCCMPTWYFEVHSDRSNEFQSGDNRDYQLAVSSVALVTAASLKL